MPGWVGRASARRLPSPYKVYHLVGGRDRPRARNQIKIVVKHGKCCIGNEQSAILETNGWVPSWAGYRRRTSQPVGSLYPWHPRPSPGLLAEQPSCHHAGTCMGTAVLRVTERNGGGSPRRGWHHGSSPPALDSHLLLSEENKTPIGEARGGWIFLLCAAEFSPKQLSSLGGELTSGRWSSISQEGRNREWVQKGVKRLLKQIQGSYDAWTRRQQNK